MRALSATKRSVRTPFNLRHAPLNVAQLERIRAGGDQMLDAVLALQKKQQTVLTALIPKSGAFTLWERYPAGEVSDAKTACQYYYHAHRTSAREHGHFHLFGLLNADATPRQQGTPWGEHEAPSHLIAISMNPQGMPIKIFCPNQWVTQGYWLSASQIMAQLDLFSVRAQPRWQLVGNWLAGFIQLFRPQIESALLARDAQLNELRRGRRWRTFWADETIEVINYMPIDLHKQIGILENLTPKGLNS